MGQTALTQSPRYRNFVNERDRVLEQIHQNAQSDITKMSQDLFEEIKKVVSYLVLQNPEDFHQAQVLSLHFERATHELMARAFASIKDRVRRMRRAVYVLTFASELEAIGQATNKQKTINLTSHQLKQVEDKKTLRDESLEKRIWKDLMKLRFKLLDAFALAMVQELPPVEVLQKISDALPKPLYYKRPPRNLKTVKEADGKRPEFEIVTSIIDDADWNLVTQAYKDTELPASRFQPGTTFDRDAGHMVYNWELEQDMTDDFVKQVRDGQVDAGKEMGIKDFVWVAIIDAKTDECCLHRNGMTTSEIENALASGKLDASKCDAIVPPAHPNCRCQLAPVGNVDSVEGPDWKSFNDWLNT